MKPRVSFAKGERSRVRTPPISPEHPASGFTDSVTVARLHFQHFQPPPVWQQRQQNKETIPCTHPSNSISSVSRSVSTFERSTAPVSIRKTLQPWGSRVLNFLSSHASDLDRRLRRSSRDEATPEAPPVGGGSTCPVAPLRRKG